MSEYIDGLRRMEKDGNARILQFSLEKLASFQSDLDKSRANRAKFENNRLEITQALAKVETILNEESALIAELEGQISEVNIAIANASHNLSGVNPRGLVEASKSYEGVQIATDAAYESGLQAGRREAQEASQATKVPEGLRSKAEQALGDLEEQPERPREVIDFSGQGSAAKG